jgi:hypothetical protein
MGTAPKKPSPSTGAGKGKGGTPTPSQRVPLTELLAKEGAPWRPFEDKGVLVKASRTPRDAKTIFATCEKQLVSHLKAVCLWPEKGRNDSWRVGDYSFYILEFTPAPRTGVYVQLWSEPDEEGAIFEVSSGAWNPPADKYVDPGVQEQLRDHGFEIGGNAENFRKIVGIEGAKDLRAVAREAMAVLCKVLRYDGTQELRYTLSLQTPYTVRHVLSEVSPYTLGKMLDEWGFPAELTTEKDQRPIIEVRTDFGPFAVLFGDEVREGARHYHALKLRTFRKVPAEKAFAAANELTQRMLTLKASVDEDGDLLLESQVLMHGGVTPEHLHSRFVLWRWLLGEIGTAIV